MRPSPHRNLWLDPWSYQKTPAVTQKSHICPDRNPDLDLSFSHSLGLPDVGNSGQFKHLDLRRTPLLPPVIPIAAQSRHCIVVGVSCDLVHGAALTFLEAKTRRLRTRFSVNGHVLCRSKQSAEAFPMGDSAS
jgi:hypothetical protein